MSSFNPSLATVARGVFAAAAGLGIIAAGIGALVAATLYYGQGFFIYPPAYRKIGKDNGIPAEPASYGLYHELVDLKTKDEEVLKCYLLLQKKDLPQSTKFSSLPTVPISAVEGATESGYSGMADEELVSHRPTVIIFHGNGGNAGHRIPLGMMFQQVMRCNVLGVEYRGYGDSTGTPSENGFALDAVTALEFVRGDSRLRNTPVILYGQGIGGAVSIDLASRCPGEISGIILENTFLSLRLLIPHVLPFLGPFTWLCHQRWESAGKVIGTPDHTSQSWVEEGLVREKEDMQAKEAFRKRLEKANEMLDSAAAQVTEGKGSLARVGKGLGKEYMGIPRETNVLLLSGQSDMLVPPTHMQLLCQIFQARPHTRRTLGLSPLPISQKEESEDTVEQERSQFILFPGGTHADTTAQHGYWNRIGDFVAEVGKVWRELRRVGKQT